MWETFTDLLSKDLLAKWGLAGIIIIGLFSLCIWLFKRSMDDKDKTITELREENRHYRDLFRNRLDASFGTGASVTTNNPQSTI